MEVILLIFYDFICSLFFILCFKLDMTHFCPWEAMVFSNSIPSAAGDLFWSDAFLTNDFNYDSMPWLCIHAYQTTLYVTKH